MRRILVDYARRRQYQKRGGGMVEVTLSDASGLANGRSSDLVALDEALKSLAEVDERRSRVVELRFFGGLSIEETAECLRCRPLQLREIGRLQKRICIRRSQIVNRKSSAAT